jgi:hypothetical protein
LSCFQETSELLANAIPSITMPYAALIYIDRSEFVSQLYIASALFFHLLGVHVHSSSATLATRKLEAFAPFVSVVAAAVLHFGTCVVYALLYHISELRVAMYLPGMDLLMGKLTACLDLHHPGISAREIHHQLKSSSFLWTFGMLAIDFINLPHGDDLFPRENLLSFEISRIFSTRGDHLMLRGCLVTAGRYKYLPSPVLLETSLWCPVASIYVHTCSGQRSSPFDVRLGNEVAR